MKKTIIKLGLELNKKINKLLYLKDWKKRWKIIIKKGYIYKKTFFFLFEIILLNLLYLEKRKKLYVLSK